MAKRVGGEVKKVRVDEAMAEVKNPPSEEGGFVNAPSKGALFTPALIGLALASLLSLDA